MKRVVSWVLAVALMITSFNLDFGMINAKAAEGDLTLYFKLPDGDVATDWGFDAWGGATVTNPNGSTVDLSSKWGEEKIYPALDVATEEGWAKITINGNVDGCQFVSIKDDVVRVYNCWNSRIAIAELTEAYFFTEDEKWYKESTKTTEIIAPTLDEIYYVVGDAPFTWTLAELTDDFKMTEKESGVYTLTKTGLSVGRYQYKVLQDPADFKWKYQYKSDMVNDYGNSYFDIANTTDTVTITIDTAGDSVVVTATVVPGEEQEYQYKEGDVKLYMKLPEGSDVFDWGVNVWPGTVEVRDSITGFKPEGWKNSVVGLKIAEDNDEFAYVIINGSVEGCQFVDKAGANVYSCWNSKISSLGLKEAYFDAANNKWYKESTFATEIPYPVLDDLYYVVGNDPFTWSLSELTEKFQLKETSEGSKVFEYTNKGTTTVLTPGQLQFKVIQDPEDFAWKFAYRTEGTEGANSIVTVRRADDILTLRLDATDAENKVLTADLRSKYNVTVTNGTISENEVYSGTTATIKADTPATGKTFDKWVCEDAELADITASETTFTMPVKDVTVEATYKDLEYTVTFKDGDETLKTEKVKYGKSATAPEVAAKEGYTLSWDRAFDNVTSDLEVKVVRTPKKYKVIFKDGDTVLKEEEVEYDKNATAPEVAAKEGYVLTWDTAYTNIKADTVVKAVWKEKLPDQFEVKFVSDGQVIDTQVVEKGKAATAPANLAKEGYTLTWDKAFDNITEYTVVTAKWVVITFKVIFKDGDTVLKEETVEYGKSATAPEVTAKEGQILSWDKAFDKVTADVEVKAVWTARTYKVIFKDGAKVVKTEEVEYGKGATAPKGLKKTGYTLSWNKAFHSIKADTVVKAVWKINKYKVKYDVNGGSEVSSKYKTVNYGTKLGKLPTTKRKGYVLEGWFTSSEKKVSEDTVVKSNMTVHARWKEVSVPRAIVKEIHASSRIVEISSAKNVAGYEVYVSENSNFKVAKKFSSKNNKIKMSGLKRSKIYYVKARAYKRDSTGAKVYGRFGPQKKFRAKK